MNGFGSQFVKQYFSLNPLSINEQLPVIVDQVVAVSAKPNDAMDGGDSIGKDMYSGALN